MTLEEMKVLESTALEERKAAIAAECEAEDADVDALKAKADADKVVFVLPKDAEADTVAATFKFVVSDAKKLNVKKDKVSVKFIGAAAEIAQAFVDYAVDELEAEFEDAEEF